MNAVRSQKVGGRTLTKINHPNNFQTTFIASREGGSRKTTQSLGNDNHYTAAQIKSEMISERSGRIPQTI